VTTLETFYETIKFEVPIYPACSGEVRELRIIFIICDFCAFLFTQLNLFCAYLTGVASSSLKVYAP